MPKGYFSPNDITLSGNPDVEGVSVFSLSTVTLNGNNTDVSGIDQAYGNWYRPPYNTTARPVTDAGIAAQEIDGSEKMGTRDFDELSTYTGPRFRPDPTYPMSSSEITFPFDYKSAVQGNAEDAERIQFLREIAKEQGNYHPFPGGQQVDVGTDFSWPTAKDGVNTIVFVEYTSAGATNRVDWSLGDDCGDPPVEGTLVVYNGNFRLTQNTTPLKGVVVVRGGEVEDGDATNVGGRTCLDGFINASGVIEVVKS